MDITKLEATVKTIATPGKGILAADESNGTIKKRFQAINLESTAETRRDYRELLFTVQGVHKYISGVILFEETLKQKNAAGALLTQVLTNQGIIPGIKVDKGLVMLENTNEEKVTQGLDGLQERLQEYKTFGAAFAKWRAVFNIGEAKPSRLAIKINAELLARYAAICQSEDIVPIVEPEILMDGNHTIEQCFAVSVKVLHSVFHALHKHKVMLEGIILKPNMVIAGKECTTQANVNQVAEMTLKALRETVPAAVSTINFLSGGQSEAEATAHLNAMNQSKTVHPWYLSFSYGRALQASCLKVWGGKADNKVKAQQEFLRRAKLNSLATLGKYEKGMEKA